MSTFPTAFWKKQPATTAEDLTISWTTSLAQSYGDNGTTPPSEFSFPVGNSYDLTNHNYPFTVTEDEAASDFYYYYEDATWQGNPSSSSTPYFGWYRDGGPWDQGQQFYDLSPDFHKSNPWIIDGFDRPNELHLFFEADLASSLYDGWDSADPYGIFNNFIQSGNATGTFNISSSQAGKDLVVKVSGLGEDASYLVGAQNYDAMRLYLERPNVSPDDLICSGCAPMDDRNVMELDNNIDVQQVKLYTGSNIYSPANHNCSFIL